MAFQIGANSLDELAERAPYRANNYFSIELESSSALSRDSKKPVAVSFGRDSHSKFAVVDELEEERLKKKKNTGNV